jgi:hypothetical protein
LFSDGLLIEVYPFILASASDLAESGVVLKFIIITEPVFIDELINEPATITAECLLTDTDPIGTAGSTAVITGYVAPTPAIPFL